MLNHRSTGDAKILVKYLHFKLCSKPSKMADRGLIAQPSWTETLWSASMRAFDEWTRAVERRQTSLLPSRNPQQVASFGDHLRASSAGVAGYQPSDTPDKPQQKRRWLWRSQRMVTMRLLWEGNRRSQHPSSCLSICWSFQELSLTVVNEICTGHAIALLLRFESAISPFQSYPYLYIRCGGELG